MFQIYSPSHHTLITTTNHLVSLSMLSRITAWPNGINTSLQWMDTQHVTLQLSSCSLCSFFFHELSQTYVPYCEHMAWGSVVKRAMNE